MSKRRCCCIAGCKVTHVSLHSLPKERHLRDQWLMFIFSRVPQDFSPNLLVCSAHFSPDCFINLKEYNAGFAKLLRLKDSAVPTLSASTSNNQTSITQHCVRLKHVGTQTDPPQRSTVGTQLSIKTLRGHVRSKSTQAGESFVSEEDGWGVIPTTEETPMSKRPRLEPLEDEEEEEGIAEIIYEI